MSIREKKIPLEDVLNNYVSTEQNPSHEGLTKWIQQYPEYKKELTEFTVNWGLIEHLPHVLGSDEVNQETLVLRAMSIVEDRLHAAKKRMKITEAIGTDLLATCKSSGMDVDTMASRCRVSVPIMMKLSRRFIEYSTIPPELIECIATTINRSTQAVIDYLRRPISVKGMQFSAKTTPKLPNKQEDFFDLVRDDQTLGEELQNYWLSLEKSELGKD